MLIPITLGSTFLKHKSETLHAFKLFHKFVQTQFQTTNKVVQSNYEGEFRTFTNYLTKLGVSHRVTCPHMFNQNGKVERKHKHVIKMGLTLLSHDFIPLHFWEHGFASAIHVINQLPNGGIGRFQSHLFTLFCSVKKYLSVLKLKITTESLPKFYFLRETSIKSF